MNIFSKEYWLTSAKELKKTRTLVFAAIMIALRLVLKSLALPIVPGQLEVQLAFLVNALGASVFGPVVALISAAISDTLGCIIHPSGPYFFPFIFVEMTGSLIFALFLYKQKQSVVRIMLSRLCVVLACNLILNPVIMKWYNMLFYGKEYELLVTLRIVKNLLLFVPETLLLCIFFKAVNPVLAAVSFAEKEDLRISLKHFILLFALSLVCVFAFCVYREATKEGSIPLFAFVHNFL